MMTVILTGLWNTGKDHAAMMLRDMGIKMDFGNRNEATLDDYELAYLFSLHPQTIPVGVIRNRDLVDIDWGTKLGMLWNSCSHATVSQIFTNPRVIIMQRDLAMIKEESGRAPREIAEEFGRSLYWAEKLNCPVMHLSAEKLFRRPNDAAEAVRGFLS